MNEKSAAYPLGGSEVEKQRLLVQAKTYEPIANALLDQVGIKEGWRAVDIGCGPIGILDLLSPRVGATGKVVGVERESRFVAMAEQEIAKRALQNVTVIEADALNTGLEKGSFDFAHERLVLINVREREAFLAEMASLLRPGGVMVLEDVDNVSWLCQPAHASWNVLFDTFHSAFHRGGGDGFIGRRLPELMRRAGIRDIKTKINVETLQLGDYRRTHLVSLIDSIREKIVSAGLLSAEVLEQHRKALLEHLNDPTTTVIEKLLVQCWGRKP
jgi:SAM-dependent methyltransferase